MKAKDAATIATIRPKLTNEQKRWMENLKGEALEMVEDVLQQDGEAYFFDNWTYLRNQMEYVETLL